MYGFIQETKNFTSSIAKYTFTSICGEQTSIKRELREWQHKHWTKS